MRAEPSPRENELLAALPAADYERLRPHLALVPLPLGKVLYEPGSPLRQVYFPVSGVVTLLYTMQDGSTAQIAVIGRDGFVGVAIVLGGGSTPSRAVVQVAGYAYRASAETVLAHFRGGGTVPLLLRYVQALMTQMSQTAACNRHHTVEQQLCRWLLLTLDLMDSDEILITQELLGSLLGVRRTGVTAAARRLIRAGVMEHRRGRIRIPDRGKLQAHACECYAAVRREIDRLFAHAP